MLIIVTILYVIIATIARKIFNSLLAEGQRLETIWTLTPSLVLIFIAFPSIKVLYITEDVKTAAMTLKATGSQWYWSYEVSDLNTESERTFIEETNKLRLLKCSSSILIPSQTHTQIVTTATDVIHAWAVPSLAAKVDAVPGRLNQIFIMPKRTGLYTGQCSEICGANHSFIPILLERTPILQITIKLNT